MRVGTLGQLIKARWPCATHIHSIQKRNSVVFPSERIISNFRSAVKGLGGLQLRRKRAPRRQSFKAVADAARVNTPIALPFERESLET